MKIEKVFENLQLKNSKSMDNRVEKDINLFNCMNFACTLCCLFSCFVTKNAKNGFRGVVGQKVVRKVPHLEGFSRSLHDVTFSFSI